VLFHSDHERFCAECLKIRDKRGSVVPLRLTPAQVKLHAAVRRQQAAGKPVRLVDLKARQVHMSVGVAAEFFRDVAFFSGQRAFVVGDTYQSAKQIWGYYDQFERSYQPGEDGPKILRVVRRHQDELIEFAGGGFIKTATAKNVQIGRSFSLRYLHLSEFAFYGDASTMMTGLLQCVPDDPGTMIVIESTANGVGGPFWDYWQMATDPSSDCDWVPLFFAWWEHPEYVRPLEVSPDRFLASLADEERKLHERDGITFEQLNWRRWAISNKCEGSIDKFHQEYPATPEEAFITSGRPRFDMISLGRMPVVRDPLVGDLERTTVGTQQQIQFWPKERGALRIWRKPVPGHRYVIGADSAEGIDAAGEGLGISNPDYFVAQVLDRETGEQVAEVRERLEPAASADYLATLGVYYNWAYLVPEANNTGIAVIEELLRLQYPVHLIYQRRRAPDDRRAITLQEIGWKTTTVTKPQLVSALDVAIREASIIIHDPVTIQECRTFIIKASGATEAQEGCHDDTVMALGLAVMGLRTAPKERVLGTNQTAARTEPVRYRGAPVRRVEDDDYVTLRR